MSRRDRIKHVIDCVEDQDDSVCMDAAADAILALVRAREDQLVAEVERLRGALHNISLCSQNSASSKEECGRIARQALQGDTHD